MSVDDYRDSSYKPASSRQTNQGSLLSPGDPRHAEQPGRELGGGDARELSPPLANWSVLCKDGKCSRELPTALVPPGAEHL